jgi:hypothetical protein
MCHPKGGDRYGDASPGRQSLASPEMHNLRDVALFKSSGLAAVQRLWRNCRRFLSDAS